jgi:RNA polymerase sigma factor (sigma-70 family)
MTDHQLLRRFAAEHSEDAFSELVAQYLPLVYSAGLRQTGGDIHLARDIAQLVFTDLARKAPSLSENVVLPGWLHRATVFAARQTIRGERRRQLREQQAVSMNIALSETEDADWRQIRPLLDEALDQLHKTDRDALLLRYFHQQSLAEVGAHLGSTEEAARKRVTRALEKLRSLLQRLGVTTTAAALTTTISANAIQTAPAGLVAVIAHASFAAAGTKTTLSLLKIMTATHLKLGLSLLAAAGVATTFVIQHQTQARLREENQSLQQQIAQLQSSNNDLTTQMADSNDTKKMSDDQFNDLLRLRSEVGLLRHQTNDLAKSQASLQNSLAQAQATALQQSNSVADQEKQIAIARINNAHHLTAEMILYASDNQGQTPTNFDQVGAYTNQFPASTTNGFEIVYQGSLNQITNTASVIVVQSDPWPTFEGKWAKAYGFADGHAEVHVETNVDFSAFEQQHSAPPANSQ